jgi:signal transduction histidine kinase
MTLKLPPPIITFLEACSSPSLVFETQADAVICIYQNGAWQRQYANPLERVTWQKVFPNLVAPPASATVCFTKLLVLNELKDVALICDHHPEVGLMIVSVFSSPLLDPDRLKSQADFMSTVSHEFRTPLTSIKGFADTLLRYGPNLEPEQQKRFIQIIKHQADRLTRLVENVLTASRLGADKTPFSYRAIVLKPMVDNIIQSIQAKLDYPRHFNVQLPENCPPVWADPDKLEQILLNLIDNAAKYSPNQSSVVISAYDDPQCPDKLKIQVRDFGVGIPAEHLPHLFSQFSRIDNPLTREVEGTGLGLYITKALTLAMGGSIEVSSRVGEGSTFTVGFDIASPQKQAAEKHLDTLE